MATGGATDTRKAFILPSSSITLIVTEGNIIETSAEALATGEDEGMAGFGEVSRLLLKSCPPAYKKAREQLKKNTKKFEMGKIYLCDFPKAPGKQGVSFGMVLHTIVPSAKAIKNQKDWKDQMKTLYYRLFKMANIRGKASLALPLMGSGGAGASVDVAADVLTHALSTFRIDYDPKSPRQCLREIILYARRDTFSKVVATLDGKLKPVSLPNGASVKSGSGKPRPQSSSSSRGRNPVSARGTGRGGHNAWSTSKPAPSASSSARNPPDIDQDRSNLAEILGRTGLDNPSSFPTGGQPVDCGEVDGGGDGSAGDTTSGSEASEDEDETCPICLDVVANPKKLPKCGHTFCKGCIEDSFKHHKPVCPSCNTVYGVITGSQPRGTMGEMRVGDNLPGYDNCGQIIIDYNFPSGIQGPEHPHPGLPYHGTSRRAFLPDSPEGRKVYRLLCVAFENRLIFTVGRSVTTGHDNVVTWNDIHHKTNPFGGATGFGYPDPLYLTRVQEELAAKGITQECLVGRNFNL
ncbi:hypothetical protein ACOMHN_053915 [Nucella lapillus]